MECSRSGSAVNPDLHIDLTADPLREVSCRKKFHGGWLNSRCTGCHRSDGRRPGEHRGGSASGQRNSWRGCNSRREGWRAWFGGQRDGRGDNRCKGWVIGDGVVDVHVYIRYNGCGGLLQSRNILRYLHIDIPGTIADPLHKALRGEAAFFIENDDLAVEFYTGGVIELQ